MTTLQHLPLFVRDYLVDTVHLSLVESGAYLHLLMHAWVKGGTLPDDDKILAACVKLPVASWLKIKPQILPFWIIENGVWQNKRLSRELEFVKANTEKRRQAGSKGGYRKHKNQTLSSSKAIAPTLTPTPTPIEEERKTYGLSKETTKKVNGHKKPKENPTRLEPDWMPSEDDCQIGIDLGLTPAQIEDQHMRFQDYWIARPGAGGTKLNWGSTFRNWLRKAADDKHARR